MRGIETIRKANNGLASAIERQGGFLYDAQIPELIKIDRLMLVLVRCGNGRFMCPVQDLNHFIGIIEEHSKMVENVELPLEPSDYVRDVSLPAA